MILLLLSAVCSLIDLILFQFLLMNFYRSHEICKLLQGNGLGAECILCFNPPYDCNNHVISNFAPMRLHKFLKVANTKLIIFIHVNLSEQLKNRAIGNKFKLLFEHFKSSQKINFIIHQLGHFILRLLRWSITSLNFSVHYLIP